MPDGEREHGLDERALGMRRALPLEGREAHHGARALLLGSLVVGSPTRRSPSHSDPPQQNPAGFGAPYPTFTATVEEVMRSAARHFSSRSAVRPTPPSPPPTSLAGTAAGSRGRPPWSPCRSC